MTFTLAATWVSTGTASLSLTTHTAGNCVLVFAANNSTSVYPAGISGGGCTWTEIGTVQVFTTRTYCMAVYAGTVVTPGTATATLSGSVHHTIAAEFAPSSGTWSADTYGYVNQGSGTTWASLTPAADGSLYAGYAINSGSASAGSTSGYVYNADVDGVSNGAAYNLSCPAGVATAAVWADSGELAGRMVVIRDGTSAAPVTSSGAVTLPAAAMGGSAAAASGVTSAGSLTVPAAALAGTTSEVTTAAGSLTVPAAALAGTGGETQDVTGSLTLPAPAIRGVSGGGPDHIVMAVYEGYTPGWHGTFTDTLIAAGCEFTDYHAVPDGTDLSEPAYIAFSSGSDQGMTTDSCPQSTGAENLWHEMQSAGKTLVGYFEDMPSAGYTGCTSGHYYRRHNPFIQFTNITDQSINVPFTGGGSWPGWDGTATDYSSLPLFTFVKASGLNDGHDGSMTTADTWADTNLGNYAAWAADHNSLLVLIADDCNGAGTTLCVITGAGVAAGSTYTARSDHTALANTLADLLGVPELPSGLPAMTGWYSGPAVTASGSLAVPAAGLAGTGGETLDVSGSLTLPAPGVAGVTGTLIGAAGGIVLPAAGIAGTGTETQDAAGSLTVPAAAAGGTGTTGTATAGALTVPAAGMSGAGGSGSFTIASGSLTVPAARLAGTGTETLDVTGSLTVPRTVLAGAAAMAGPVAAAGSLTVPVLTVTGTATPGTIAAGALAVPAAALTGTAAVANPVTSSGSLTVPALRIVTILGVPLDPLRLGAAITRDGGSYAAAITRDGGSYAAAITRDNDSYAGSIK